VAGNAKVGNRINMITRWQALEYIGAQNLERRALAALGTLTVVPGAIGAWRRQAVEQLGGFPGDTVAEDQDLYNAEFNRAFVLAEYFGYLRRNPDEAPNTDFSGFDFWLNKLNQFGDYKTAEMVKAFISSNEYRQRFGN